MMNREYPSRTLCILLSGRAGVGKTTCANFMSIYFDKMGHKSYVGHFAHGVKSVARILGWDGQKDDRGRKLLQQVGSIGREYDQDIWCRNLFEEEIPADTHYPYEVVLVDDWRFPNERTFVNGFPEYMVFTIRIHSPEREILKGTEQALDSSETSLPDDSNYYDVHIDNFGIDIKELEKLCYSIADSLFEKIPKWKEDK